MLPLVCSTKTRRSWICAIVLAASLVDGLSLDVSSTDSLKSTAKILAEGLLAYYNPYQTGDAVGTLPAPPAYYWWESGGMWGALVDYSYATDDHTYDSMTITGIQAQTGPDDDFEPPSQNFDLGNDDQCYWAITAMAAAEYNFENPPKSDPGWLELAQAVFNRQQARWDYATCGGGLRWQVPGFGLPAGYDYKNSVSNGCFFDLAARLAKYTGNKTYQDWAEKAYDWELSVGLIDPGGGWRIYDGTTPSINCSQIDHDQWTYNVGIHLHGAAVLWNMTQNDTWKTRVEKLLDPGTTYFFTHNVTPPVMFEAECEPTNVCNSDQYSFKAYLSRFMAATAQIAPYTADSILPLLQESAVAAVDTCTTPNVPNAAGFTTNVTQCGTKWYLKTFDGVTGAGQQMTALSIVTGLLIMQRQAPVTANTGGTSVGNPAAGGGVDPVITTDVVNITSKDKGGAWFLTVMFAICTIGAGAYILF